MSVEQGLVAVCIAVVGVLAVVVVLSWRQVARLRREMAGLRADLEVPGAASSGPSLQHAHGDAPVTDSEPADAAFVITGVGTGEGTDPDAPTVPARIEGRLFVDIVAREALVKSAGLAHGLRRAASPEVRNRIRFEMRRELKRARRQRRADLKVALRDLRRRQREDLDPDPTSDPAASDPTGTDSTSTGRTDGTAA